jgi:hypothetical protein
MKEKILRAFYHKSRREFTPWLATEIAKRTGFPPDEVNAHLGGLARSGHTKPHNLERRGGTTIWELTALGKIEAGAIIAAQAVARLA